MSHETQLLQIQRHLAKGHSLTQLEALRKFGTMRLGARVWDLRRLGFPVKSELIEVGDGKRVARYSIPRARGKN